MTRCVCTPFYASIPRCIFERAAFYASKPAGFWDRHLTEHPARFFAGNVIHAPAISEAFYHCNNEKTRHVEMCNLGCRLDGRRHTLAIPECFAAVAVRASEAAARQQPGALVVLQPDVCVVNRYGASSMLGLHQDAVSRRGRKVPVVSISLGRSAHFVFRRSFSKKCRSRGVTLRSGDVLVFGGPSRSMPHGMACLDDEDSGAPDFAGSHRVCVTLRER